MPESTLPPPLPPFPQHACTLTAPTSPLTSTSPTFSTDSAFTEDLPPTKPRRPTPSPRLPLDAFRRSMSRATHDNHSIDERPVSHEARVLYALITGSIPPPAPPSRTKRVLMPIAARRAAVSPTYGVVSLATVAQPEVSDVKAKKGGKPTTATKKEKKDAEQSWPVPNVPPKTLKKLKADLMKADKARIIVSDLKRMEAPPDESSTDSPSFDNPTPRRVSRGYALPPLSDFPAASLSSSTSSHPPFTLLDIPSLPATSPGALAGLGAAQTGVFELLADASGALVKKSGVHEGLLVKPPVDRVSIYIWWWGFEIMLPPPAIRALSSVASVQQSFFSFLQAFILAGGAPELAPLARYLSSYLDMEWSAIRAQNKGHGVVLAATWILPIALVPRPWDLQLPFGLD